MRSVLVFICLLVVGSPVWGQTEESLANWAARAGWNLRVTPNIVYKRANNYDCKLDVLAQGDPKTPRPTLIYIHGGGWVGGTKDHYVFFTAPYLAKGMNVVNVGYRLAEISPAPAAVADCRCALRWIYSHAQEYGFDLSRLVVSGHSAGGHLSLITGMLTAEAGLDNECPLDTVPPVKVAAIVNFYGITDVADVMEGPNRRNWAALWMGTLPNRRDVAKLVSPLNYVRPILPAIFTVHGDADQAVPYQHAVRLHEALKKAGVTEQLLTIPGGKHGGFTTEQQVMIQEAIFKFLKQQSLLP
jgi:acetyl esterase/lipase